MHRHRLITFGSLVTISILVSTFVIVIIGQFVNSNVVPKLAINLKAVDWTMVTHIFAHGNYEHWTLNATLIALLGPSIEERYGSITTLLMIIATAFIAGIVGHCIISSCVGLSTIVYMMLVLNLFRDNENGIPFISIFIIAFFVLPEFFAGNAGIIAHWAHITGALCGFGFGFLTKFFNFGRKV